MPRFLLANSWLFAAPESPVTPLRVIGWWEVRRIPFNLILAASGLLSLAVFALGISMAHVLQPGEDAIEPIALLFVPIAANICFTLGWLLEAPLRLIFPSLTPRFGPLLLRLGVGFSLLVVSLPALYWGGYCVLHWCQIIP